MNSKGEQVDPGSDTRNRTNPDEQEESSADRSEQDRTKGHGPLKGTDTLATTDAAYIDREKGKRTTM
jgi:hypothetical protein